MSKKIKHLEKSLQFSCPVCHAFYQLLEIHYAPHLNWLKTGKCSDNCANKWQAICQEHYKEKVLAQLALQEEAQEKEAEELEDYDWLKKSAK